MKPVVVVTGASAGIGRATAIAFGRMGWRVALVARGMAGLEARERFQWMPDTPLLAGRPALKSRDAAILHP